MLRLGKLDLGPVPRIAVPLRDTCPEGTEAQLRAQGADLVELRIDQFSDHAAPHVLNQLRQYQDLPVLATIRRREEGGAWPGTEEQRRALYEAVLPAAAAVDVELGAVSIRDGLCEATRAAGKLCILSHHNFEQTPPDTTLDTVVAEGLSAGADIVKIAAHCQSQDDLRRLAALLIRHQNVPLIVIGMGSASALSRIFFPALGSLISYAAWDTPSAPGQLTLRETRSFIDRFYPAQP
jgi:3-dehydroquinate dehydratase-1